jgi:hypothetical protein
VSVILSRDNDDEKMRHTLRRCQSATGYSLFGAEGAFVQAEGLFKL